MKARLLHVCLGLVGAALLTAGACGGKSPAAPAPPPSAAPTAAPTPTPPPPIAGYSATCSSVGYGSPDVSCEGADSAFIGDVEDAIDKLIADKPEIFNLKVPAADGGIRVVDVEAYHQGVIDNLSARRLCAAMSFGNQTLLVKRSNEFSEVFVILSPRESTRRGPSLFGTRCTPAEFPLRVEDAIAYIRVAFFGINCPEGVSYPPLPVGRLPLTCNGYVTATPKDRRGQNVPLFLHGPEISWRLRLGDGVVATRPQPEVPFNQVVQAVKIGNFSLCATVKDVEGCLEGRVIP